MPDAKLRAFMRALILIKPQQTLNTENPWLNVIVIHSKFISSPFIFRLSTVISIISPSFASLYRDDIVV